MRDINLLSETKRSANRPQRSGGGVKENCGHELKTEKNMRLPTDMSRRIRLGCVLTAFGQCGKFTQPGLHLS